MSTVKRWGEEIRSWAGSSIRFSGFTVLFVALVVGGVVIISPSLSTFVQQRREIAELRESVAQKRAAVDEIDAERARWKDPVYVRAQARDRLFYVLPGETQLSVIDDVTLPVTDTAPATKHLERAETNWAQSLGESFVQAGTIADKGSELDPDE